MSDLGDPRYVVVRMVGGMVEDVVFGDEADRDRMIESAFVANDDTEELIVIDTVNRVYQTVAAWLAERDDDEEATDG